ncbi:tRNA pseudouridine(55) synthase TruB [Caldibacillus thermoamylovorans]
MNGVIPLWKPKGMTSHDCVIKIRKLVSTKKVGHSGTLDPNVTGVLPICVGEATKIVQYVTNFGKCYQAEITIGNSTTTEDSDGDIVQTKPVKQPITRDEILKALKQLTGEITQIPPMYSAVKVNGKRLYEYAREGIEIERPERTVTIYALELLDDNEIFNGEFIRFSVHVKCSKGTYIRTLAVMIGELLGYPAHMSKLVRTSAGGIEQEQCLTFEQIEEKITKGLTNEIFLPIESVLFQLPKYEIHDTLANRVKNGALIPIPDHLLYTLGPIAVYYKGKILAIYKHHPTKQGILKPDRVFVGN